LHISAVLEERVQVAGIGVPELFSFSGGHPSCSDGLVGVILKEASVIIGGCLDTFAYRAARLV
jgi:hypothetical protein